LIEKRQPRSAAAEAVRPPWRRCRFSIKGAVSIQRVWLLHPFPSSSGKTVVGCVPLLL